MWSGRLKELVTKSLKPSTSRAIIHQFPGSWVMNEKNLTVVVHSQQTNHFCQTSERWPNSLIVERV